MSGRQDRPCGTCPFRRTVSPGELGGSPPEVYVAQVLLPYLVPCHKHIDYSDQNWKEACITGQQCVGVAMIRDAMGVAQRMPDALLRAEHIDEVFPDLYHFWAHHKRVSVEQAKAELTPEKLRQIIITEITRSGAKFHEPNEFANPNE